jgi:hypothetical protein
MKPFFDINSFSWNPTIAVDEAGYVHIAWEDATDYNGAGADFDIFYKRTGDIPEEPVLAPILPNPDTDGVIELNWSNVVNATIYYIYRDTSAIIIIDGLSPLSAVLTSNYTDEVNQNGIYYYAVIAGTGLINSSLSNCENVTVAMPGPLTPVLAPIVPNPDLDGVIRLNWSAVVGASIYYVYRATSNITSVLGMTPIQVVATNSCLDTLTTNGLYYYVVVAGNATGNSTPSNCESVQVVLFEIPGFELLVNIFSISLLMVAVRFIKRKCFGKGLMWLAL